MTRTLLLAIPAAVLLIGCGSPEPTPDTAYRSGYSDGYRAAAGDRYGYSSTGYNDRYAYRPGYSYYPSRYRDVHRPSDY